MATFYNQATLSYGGGVTNSNVVSGELVELLTVTKTAIPATYRPGDTVTYVVSIVNAGQTPYTGLTVTDDLGSYAFGEGQVVPLTYKADSALYYLDGALQTSVTARSGPPLTVTGVAVPAEGNAMLIYSAVVNEYAPPAAGDSIMNTVTVSGGGLSEPLIASETVSAEAAPLLTITKAVNPTTVVGNGPLTYSFTIQNVGVSEAGVSDSVSVSDRFDPILTLTGVTYNGAPLAEGTDYTYDGTTGLFETVPGRITVPAGSYTQDETGRYLISPGIGVLTVTGTV